jgi:LacI family transcriptional regulator
MQTKQILVVFSKFDFTHRQMLGGILKYAHENCASTWRTQLELKDIARRNIEELRGAGFDGIIAAVINPADRRKYFATGLPVVLYEPTIAKWDHSRRPERSVTFFNDHTAEGRTAAEYFIERGYRKFAYVGTPERIAWSEARRAGFMSTLSKSGFRCAVYPQRQGRIDFMHESKRLERWLVKLPPGTALFAVHDERAQQIASLAGKAGISIPGHIAVLGVDDDELLCTTASPTLSSIPVYAAETGYRFAKALDDLLRGRSHDSVVRTCHTRVLTRQSTDISRIDDPFVSRAVEYMRRHLGDSVGGAAIAAAAHCSLRTLQIKMQSTLGRTPKEQFDFLRRTEAVALLANTSMSVDQVARACGFCGSSHLGLHLKRHLGIKPLDARREPSLVIK